MAWTEQAEELAADTRELGLAIAAIHTAAWRAQVDPAATAGLAGAATALDAPTKALFDRGAPLPQDQVMIGETEDRQIDGEGMHQAATLMRGSATRDLDAAAARLREALAALKAARSDKETAAAQAQARAAREVIADCEVALDILAEVIPRLAYAIWCLGRVPEDLAETYEAAYQFLHSHPRARLPRNGDFLTGTPATPVHPGHAMSG